MSERLAHENEINRLQQEIILAKETNSNETESTIVLPVNNENKLKKSTSSNHIHDDDEMVSINKIILGILKCINIYLVFRFCKFE